MVKFDSHIYKKLIWSNKNTFRWVVETGLKDDFICITSCEGHQLWKLSTVSVHWCYQSVNIENYLLPTHTDHYALRKLEQPLAQRF